MAPSETRDPEQLTAVAAVLAEICARAGIEARSRDYDDARQLLAHLYKNGHRTAAELRSALDPNRLAARFG